MAYNLLKDYTGNDKDTTDFVSTSPYWVLYIAGVPTPLSFSRKKSFSSVSDTASGGTRSRLIIVNDCVALQISNSKGSHTKSLAATLKQGKLNYLGSIYPGDWIMAWIVNNKTDLNTLLDSLKKDKPANNWDSGLKFVGRVNSIKKSIVLSPDGQLDSTYALDAFAFRELDSELFYDVNLSEKIIDKPGLAWLAKLNLDIKDLFEVDSKTGFTPNNGHKIVHALVRTFMGQGVGNLLDTTGVNALNPAQGAGAKKAYAYIVPTIIGKLLNRQGSASGAVGGGTGSEKIVLYTDIMKLYAGVQSYEHLGDSDKTYFYPKVSDEEGFYKFSGKELLGSFTPIFPSFINRPLWSVLQQFTNPLINEMYTALRVDNEGNIIPQIIFRQIPFTTPTFAAMNGERLDKATQKEKTSKGSPQSEAVEGPIEESGYGPISETVEGPSTQEAFEAVNSLTKVEVTPFHDLPRWVLPAILVKNISLGRSDATHVNFIHIYGQDALLKNRINIPTQLVQNPPIRDDLDIQRSGVRAFMATIPSNQLDQVGKSPTTWMQLIADQLMASHLTLNGTANCVGIHMPICEGDNVQIENMLFHIESVVHSCTITPDGMKHFITNLNITNGMSLNTKGNDTDPDNSFYLGIKDNDSVGHDAGLTIDSEFEDGDLGKSNAETDSPSSTRTSSDNSGPGQRGIGEP